MTRRMLYGALALSLLFNVAVLLGFASSQAAAPAPNAAPTGADSVERISRALELDDTQRQRLVSINRERLEAGAISRQWSSVLHNRLLAALEADKPDIEAVRDLVDQQAELDRQRRLAEADLLDEFLRTLTPRQRIRMQQQFAKSRNQRPPQDLLKRFDKNNDGRLDADELRAADEARERRRDHGREGTRDGARSPGARLFPAPPLWAWFDRDGDGALNVTERAERDEFVRTHPVSRKQP